MDKRRRGSIPAVGNSGSNPAQSFKICKFKRVLGSDETKVELLGYNVYIMKRRFESM